MSLRVLVIPEDPTHNGYILKPLVERMMKELGKPNARVTVLTSPRLQGYDDAVRAIRDELPTRYQQYDVWLFMPDADRASNLDVLEKDLKKRGVSLLCCPAKPEVEAWLLAGHREKLKLEWKQLRAHARLKEEVFEPFLTKHGDERAAGAGRSALMDVTLRSYDSLLKACPELKELQERLRTVLEGRA